MAKCGFLSDELLRVGECQIAPAAFCAALLGSPDQFRYGPEERDVAWCGSMREVPGTAVRPG
jgi:hypothetical protein